MVEPLRTPGQGVGFDGRVEALTNLLPLASGRARCHQRGVADELWPLRAPFFPAGSVARHYTVKTGHREV